MTEAVTEAPGQGGRAALGILGGTFDPVHEGHLALAAEARSVLGLEAVLFVPNADPPHKQGQPVTPARHREAMVRLAIRGRARFQLSRLELDRPGLSFTVDTVADVAARSREERRPEPWFILSAEALDDFHTWRDPLRILQLCRVAVAPRPGAGPLDRAWLAQRFPGYEDRFAFLPGPELDIASTTVRDLVARGEPISGLVPPAVERYIEEQELYRRGGVVARG